VHTPHAALLLLLPQDKFDALLPLYLSADHFNSALPHMSCLLPLLAPEAVGRGGSHPHPEAWLEVLPKILNTQVGHSTAQQYLEFAAAAQKHCHTLSVQLWPV
jgi:hypothetical protein